MYEVYRVNWSQQRSTLVKDEGTTFMPRTNAKQRFEFEGILLDPDSSETQYRQIELQIRTAITDGMLAAGARVPSSRKLAQVLGVSRNTVLAAYEQLISEGYLETSRGSGTRISTLSPEAFQFPVHKSYAADHQSVDDCLSTTGRLLSQFAKSPSVSLGPATPFRPHLPAIDEFPTNVWNRFASEQARWTTEHLQQCDSQGYRPLRESIAEYMAVSRGVTCTMENVIITSGSQQGLQLLVQVLLEQNDSVWVEEPGNLPAVELLRLLRLNAVAVPLDEHGIDITRAPADAAIPKLIYVTPGGQWPMTMTMSLKRRLALLAFAQTHNSWILEDDYNGEFRYTGRPHPALASLDQQGRTIYMGSFSKTLFPAIRLGFLVVSSGLAGVFSHARWLNDRFSPTLNQKVLYRFIESGQYLKHIRRMRSLYRERQKLLYDLLVREFGENICIELPESGMHLVVRGRTAKLDSQILSSAQRASVECHPVRAYAQQPHAARGLILGFAAFDAKATAKAVANWSREFCNS